MLEILLATMHGILLALGLILPLGVQNVFIFNQGAAQPSLVHALPGVIAASICDSTLIILAVFGISLLVLQIAWLKLFIFIAGFIFLIYMGFVIWRQHKYDGLKNMKVFSAKRQVIFAISVSLLNPHAIIDTIAIIGTNSIEYNGYAKLAYTLSCIAVSWVWFILLAFAGHHLHRLDKNGLWVKRVNQVAAFIIWGIAIYLGVHIVTDLKQIIYS